MSDSFDREEGRVLALLAVDDLIDALQELARYRREGPVCNWPFGYIDVLCLLAEALEHAAQIEAHAMSCQPAYADRLQGIGQLTGAINKFLSDHCGREHPVLETAVPLREPSDGATADDDPDLPF
jgi:hypothetical protein